MISRLPHDNTRVVANLPDVFRKAVEIKKPGRTRPYPGSCGPLKHDPKLVTNLCKAGIIYPTLHSMVNTHPQGVSISPLHHHHLLDQPIIIGTPKRPGDIFKGIFVSEQECTIHHFRIPVDSKGPSLLANGSYSRGNYKVVNGTTLLIL